MRADRLVATVLLLQARGRVTAADLAEELEISLATARRDLEALSAAGIPVYPQTGRGGGWQLIGGARTDLSGLTSAEARALFLLVGPAAAIDQEAKSALRKLVRALPETFRAEAQAAGDAVVIDPAAWGRAVDEHPELVRRLKTAVAQRRRVRITYRAWDRDPAERVVDPWGLVDKNGTWYLLGGVDGRARTYRVDRMSDAETLDEPAVRPSDFDVAEAWTAVTREVDDRRRRASASIITDPVTLAFLRDGFGDDGIEVGPGGGVDDDVDVDGDVDRMSVTVSAPTEDLIARRLAGWGDSIDVVGPASVREELARIGAALAARNA